MGKLQTAIALLIFAATLKIFYLNKELSPRKTDRPRPNEIKEFKTSRQTNLKGELDEEGYTVTERPNSKTLNFDHFPKLLGSQLLMEKLRYRMIQTLTVNNIEGYGFSIIWLANGFMATVGVKLKTPEKLVEFNYDQSAGDWTKEDQRNFSSWNTIKYITKDGFEFMISDDKTNETGKMDQNVFENTWNRAFRLKIDKENLLIEGSLTKRPNTVVYNSANTFYKNDPRYWVNDEWTFNMISTGKWVHNGVEVDLEKNSKRVFGDMIATQGIYPYKISQVYLELSFQNNQNELVTMILGDEHTKDNDMGPKDRIVLENSWSHLDPVKFVYDDNGLPILLKTIHSKDNTTDLDIMVEPVDIGYDSKNFGVIVVDLNFAIAKFNGYFTDSNGEKHDIKNAKGVFSNAYLQL